MAAAQHGVYCNAASNLMFTLTRISGVLPAKKGTDHACRNHQLPPVLEALQCKLERALSARRPRIGRYRHHPIGHSADRVGKRQPLNSREIPMKAPAVCGRFHFGSLYVVLWTRSPARSAGAQASAEFSTWMRRYAAPA